MSEVHRTGPFKQQNKSHKTGRHRSKGVIDKQLKGRADVKAVTKGQRRGLSRVSRRHRAKQLRENKRQASLAENRSLGFPASPPILTTVVCLTDRVDAFTVFNVLSSCDASATLTTSQRAVSYLSVPRFKCRFGFLAPNSQKLHEVLDTLKVSDVIVLVWPVDGVLDDWAQLLLATIFGHGIPAALHVVPNVSQFTGKQKEIARKNVTKLLDKWSFCDKFYSIDSESDGLVLLRQISGCKKRPLIMQRRRPHLLVEELETTDVQDEKCTLKLSGYMRGRTLDVNSLIHLPGWGDFQMTQIDSLPDPHPLVDGKRKNEMAEGVRMLAKADPCKQTSLQSEVVLDLMATEQTWPTEQDFHLANLEAKKRLKKVPKGTSEYQAAWIGDSDGEGQEGEDDGDEEESDSDEAMEDDEGDEDAEQPEGAMEEDSASQLSGDHDDLETMTTGTNMDTDNLQDEEIDMAQLERYRLAREDSQFPDEMDTPLDIAARVRFQKFRGLTSFRTSPWDRRENLPSDYARIFQFAHFQRTKKQALAEAEDVLDGAEHGSFVTLHLANVPLQFAECTDGSSALVVYGLLAHEQRLSVVNMVIRKHPSCQSTIKSKDKLIFHVGYRRFEAAPIFSQHTNGDKHKMERYLPTDSPVVASVYAPILFPPASVLVFRAEESGRYQLVATGAILDLNPDRVIIKRIVLSGHPFKIQKRLAVVRYMFFNRDDIEWFKPVELRTKYGRRGHIKEALGTHGHMKCVFDGQLNSQDTVLLNLYKRVFPPWTYQPRVPIPSSYRRLSTAPSSTVDHAEMQ